MINTRIKLLCKELRLDNVVESLENQMANASYDEVLFEERLLEILENQSGANLTKKIKSLQKYARLRYPDVYLEDMEMELYPSLNINQFKQLATCDWIRDKRHLMIIASTG